MVLTAATTAATSSMVAPPMTRYDRALPVNAMTEKRYSDRRLRPWPPTYNYGIPGGGGGGGGGSPAGGAPGHGSTLAVIPGGKSRWMSAGLSDIGPTGPMGFPGGGMRVAGGSSAGSIYGGSVGGPGAHRYLYAPPAALKRQNSDFFLNVKSSASLAAAREYSDYNNNNNSTSNYVVNNIAARKVKNIAGMTAIVDSDTNMEVVRRMRRHSTTQQNNYLHRLQKQQQQQQQQYAHSPHIGASSSSQQQQQQHHHQQQFFNVSASTRSRSKSMEDFGASGYIIENSYKYRAKNVLTASTTSAGSPTMAGGVGNGHGGHHGGRQQQQHHQLLNNSSVAHGSNNLSLAGGGSNSRVVSPNQSTSSAPLQHGSGGAGNSKQRALRLYNNNFGSNLNGGHSNYNDGSISSSQYQQHQQHHGKRLLSLKNHRSVDNLLDNNVDINYSQYYQQSDQNRPRFVAVTTLEDVQAVRCAEFHPNGRIYAVGSNSKTFRICEYPSLSEIREDHSTYQPTVLFKRTKHHKGSIYCMAWSPAGDLIATGSNDKTVKLMRFNESQKQLEGQEMELTMHDGTVRDLCFLEDSSNKSSLLISGGAGDCKIYVTDCETSTPFQALSGHGGHVLSLYNWGGVMFVSGSQDKTVRFWDLRTRGCVNMVTPATSPGSRQGSPVAAVCVDPSGRLLVSGHEDSSCVLYDIRGNRPIQCFKPHSSDVRSIRFSPSAYYLLTAGYDNKLVLTDLQGDLTMPLPSVVVAQHTDKVISGRWHPVDFSFLSTSADKTATLWALPPI
ncbi:WD repeat-containing protein 47 isoform X3 [Anopheles darlingi]|uniref:WD repeat-containing protein 47 isoform X3 n=1 Tax=Anopheles darlingi TaxID=43151 RepID=UPI00210053C1|nr:WD repeat-containing protein 47 isoform X3 [Anopheles darlingi]